MPPGFKVKVRLMFEQYLRCVEAVAGMGLPGRADFWLREGVDLAFDLVNDQQSVKLPALRALGSKPFATNRIDQFTSRILTGAEAFRELAAEWSRVEELTITPMQSNIWSQACVESFTDGEPILVTIQRQGRTVGLAPLFRPYLGKRLHFLGQSLFEPTLFSYVDNDACYALARAVLKLKRPVFLRDVDAVSPMAQALMQACRDTGRICITRPMPSHPWLQLDASWSRPEEHLNSGRKSDLRRARRNAEKIGAVSFLEIAPAAGELDDLLTEVFRVESANWKGDVGSGLACDPAIQEFYRRFSRLACSEGILRILLMRCGEHTAAVQLGVEYKKRFWLLKMGYDQKFARFSPGELLMVESIRSAASRGLEAFEMMGSQEGWTRKWTDLAHPSISMRVYGAGIRGLFGALVETARAASGLITKFLPRKN